MALESNAENIEVLRAAGLRPTPQRLAIVREVLMKQHPTVAEVYDSVRAEFPTIGLATVYNTLRSMTERGLVRELPFINATRFDVNLTPHANLVCTHCGAIEDSEACDDLIAALQERVAAGSFVPESQRVDIYGTCARCREAGVGAS